MKPCFLGLSVCFPGSLSHFQTHPLSPTPFSNLPTNPVSSLGFFFSSPVPFRASQFCSSPLEKQCDHLVTLMN